MRISDLRVPRSIFMKKRPVDIRVNKYPSIQPPAPALLELYPRSRSQSSQRIGTNEGLNIPQQSSVSSVGERLPTCSGFESEDDGGLRDALVHDFAETSNPPAFRPCNSKEVLRSQDSIIDRPAQPRPKPFTFKTGDDPVSSEDPQTFFHAQGDFIDCSTD